MTMGYDGRNYPTNQHSWHISPRIRSMFGLIIRNKKLKMISSTKVIKSHIPYLTVYLSINIHAQFFSFHRNSMPIVSINIFVKKILFSQRKRKKDINCNFRLVPVDAVHLPVLYFISSMQFC